MGVVFLFAQICNASGWEVIEIGAAFPDAILRKDGEIWRAEFEYQSSNFLYHQHDCRECDIIICWENDRTDIPLPIIELCSDTWKNDNFSKCENVSIETYYWQCRARRAEFRLERNIREKTAKRKAIVTPLNAGERREILRNILHTEFDGKETGILNKSELARRLDISRPTLNSDLTALIESGELSMNGHIRVS